MFISVSEAKPLIHQSGFYLGKIVACTAVFHLLLLVLGFFLVRIFAIPKGRYESILFMGAQKTLPLSVMIQISYFSAFSNALVVCVCHHIVHLTIDGYLANRLGRGPGQ